MEMKQTQVNAAHARIGAQSSVWSSAVAGLAVLLLAVLFGGLVALGNPLLSAALVGLVAIPIALFAPRQLLWATVIGALALVGLIEIYLPGLSFIRHAFVLSAGLFFLAVLIQRFPLMGRGAAKAEPVLTTAIVFLLCCLAAVVTNWQGVGNAIPGVKNYFQVWSLFLGLALMTSWAGFEKTLPRVLLVIAILQLPFALHQYLFISPFRYGIGGGIVAVDIVSGTLGGNVAGGGQNALLALFLSSAIGILLSLWRTGAIRARVLFLLLPILLLPMLLNSSRASLVYGVAIFLVVFRREILKRPARVLAGAVGLAVLGAALLVSYKILDEMQWGNRYESIWDMATEVIRKNTDEAEGYGSLTLNRTSALTFWFEEQRRYPLVKTLFGHGLSAAREGEGRLLDTSHNLANTRYALVGIGLTTTSSLLWDVGVVGTAAAFALLYTAFVQTGRLAGRFAGNAYRSGLFEGLQATILLVALSFFHKNYFTFHLGYQVLFMTLIGFIVWASRQLEGQPSVEQRSKSHPRIFGVRSMAKSQPGSR